MIFLLGLMQSDKTSQSIYYHPSNYHNGIANYPALIENFIANLIPVHLFDLKDFEVKNLKYSQDPRNFPQQLMSSYSSWMYRLPFSIGNCDATIIYDPDFHRCRANAAIYWKVNHSARERSAKHTCCFIWTLLDCMEDAIHRRCEYSFEIFQRNRLDYIARVQSNPFCFNYLYGSWNCFFENWLLIGAFCLLGLLVLTTIIVASWILFCRKRKKSMDTDYRHSDIDLEQRDSISSQERADEESRRQIRITRSPLKEDYHPTRRFLYQQKLAQQKYPEPRSSSVVSVRQMNV